LYTTQAQCYEVAIVLLYARKITVMVSVIAKQRELYLSLYCDLYTDIAEKLSVPVKESRRDIQEVVYRVGNEGLSFLTKALPQLGKALDKCLSKDEPLTIPSTFSKCKGRTVPNLFRWLFSKVITPSGFVSPEADTVVLIELRQLMYCLYKLEIPATESQKTKVLQDFVSVDAGLDKPSNIDQEWIEETSDLIRDIFALFDPADIKPSHGPGAVATGERNHEKHVFRRIYSSVERVYPFTEYYEYSLSAVADRWRQYENLEVLEEGTAKVVLVPKDSRGPRIISCEPLEIQWIQQGLGRALVAHIEGHRLTKGHVNFTDQTVNRRLAEVGSTNQKWVTLDMKEASDRVSLWLICELFAKVPRLLEALLATRSTSTMLPSGQVVRLKKFAPMGSNLCFPIESVVFYALAVTSLVREYRLKDPQKSWRRLRDKARAAVFVYGDDIIVRSEVYTSLLRHFPTIGLMFNDSKCCTAGFFRESCGKDAFKGVDVTPLRIKKVFGVHRVVPAGSIASYVAYSNAAYARSYKRLARHLASLVEGQLGELPITNRQLGFLSLLRPVRTSQPGSVSATRYNPMLQRNEIRAWRLVPRITYVAPDDWSMVLRRFTSPSDMSEPGEFAVPRRSRLIRGWSSLS
jgi:hypothetical protein